MAISEEVRIDVASRVSTPEQQNNKDMADRAAHEAAIVVIDTQIAARNALIIKYDTDIPKPTVAPEPI